MRRLLIANRGAVAARIARACRALGIQAVALCCDAETTAPVVELADDVITLPDPPPNPYLDADALLKLARQHGCDALHPGYGFLSENAAFAQATEAAGLYWVGPPPAQLAALGDKVRARDQLEALGLPVFPGSPPLGTAADVARWAERIGYPLLVKPSAGGGGIGMQIVREAGELNAAVQQARQLAERAFGDGSLFLERLVEDARHIELQLFGADGQVGHAWERDCSVQRRQQKIIEESPAPGLPRAELEALLERAVQAFGQLDYRNLGTLELLRDGEGRYGVLEVNTRLQVEHGITEAVTGLDLVALQLELARGGSVPAAPALQGHAIEARIYAEDPATGFPSTGVLRRLEWPRLHGVRVEAGFTVGQAVTPHFDPLLGKLISHGPDRDLALGRLLVALDALVIDGVSTNVRQLRAVLRSDEFAAGRWHTRRLEPGVLTAHLDP